MSDNLKDMEISEQLQIDAGDKGLAESTEEFFNTAESGFFDYLDSLTDKQIDDIFGKYGYGDTTDQSIYGDNYISAFVGLYDYEYKEIAELCNNDLSKIVRYDLIATMAQYEGTKDNDLLARFTRAYYPLILNTMLPKYNKLINTTKTGQPKKRQKIYTYDSFKKSVTLEEVHDLFNLYTKDITKRYFDFINACNAHETARILEEENREIQQAELMTDEKALFAEYLTSTADVPYYCYKVFNLDITDYERLLQQEIDKRYPDTASGVNSTKRINKPLHSITIPHNSIIPIEYPLDKINSDVWGWLTDTMPNGQLTYAVEKRGSNKQANIIFGINFDALEETAELSINLKLTPYDKRLYIAAAALFNSGYDVVTISQIYKTMGYTKTRPSGDDIKKINTALTKLTAARIYLNNADERRVYESRKRFVYDGSLFPMERVTAEVNGQITETAIHLFREPPLLTFAKERKQVTTIPQRLLSSPVNKTVNNLRIEDYLLERIAHIKNSKLKNKILYSTIFDKAGITEKKQKQRAKETINRYLEHYKSENFIKDFKEDKDSITIFY